MTSSIELPKEQRYELAIQAFHSFQKDQPDQVNLSVRKLSRQYGLPRSTLHDRIHGRQSKQTFAATRQLLKPEQEEALETYIMQLVAWGWPPRVNQVKCLAEELYSLNHPTGPPIKIGVNWVQKLLSRRTQLTSVLSTAADKKERMATHNTEKLARWFALYKKTVEDYKIESRDIYNMVEKGFAMGIQGKMKIICSKQHRSLMTADDSREWVSLTECVNVMGEVLKMWIIFKGKYQQKCWMEALEDGHITASENGWTNNGLANNEIGISWLERCFEPETRGRQQGDYRLLIVDGHQYHLTSKAIDFATKHNIIILCLPSHFTDLLQPLDVGVFGPLAQAYRNELEAMTRFGLGYAIDKTDFIMMYQKARSTVMTPQVIQYAWAKSGLWPLHPESVLGSLPSRNPRNLDL